MNLIYTIYCGLHGLNRLKFRRAWFNVTRYFVIICGHLLTLFEIKIHLNRRN